MFSKKARNIVLLGAIAALLVAVGYWNISPESFLEKPVAQVDENAIDYYAKSPGNDPPGPADGTHRVNRGGSWFDGAQACRSANIRRWK